MHNDIGLFFGPIVERLALAILIFRKQRLAYSNVAARTLAARLRAKYRVELTTLLSDHLEQLGFRRAEGPSAATLITSNDGEPFFVHVIPLSSSDDAVAVSIRTLGGEIGAIGSRYGLSVREAQIVELVLFGYANRDIARTLGISTATTKKHLTHIFDKVGVDSRTQLLSRFV